VSPLSIVLFLLFPPVILSAILFMLVPFAGWLGLDLNWKIAVKSSGVIFLVAFVGYVFCGVFIGAIELIKLTS
jgi:hypothetical protein